jgi:hypothetical protein
MALQPSLELVELGGIALHLREQFGGSLPLFN